MIGCARGAVVVLATAAWLFAQQGPPPQVVDEATSIEQALRQSRGEIERLIDLRLRHDFGLPADDSDRTLRHDGPVSSENLEQLRRQLREEEAATTMLTDRFETLRREVDRQRSDTEQRSRRDERSREVLVVPAPGSRVTRNVAARSPEADGAAPAVEPAPARSRARDEQELLLLDPLRAQIHGSTDHQRVAQALFKAGQALFDRAAVQRARNEEGLARELDDRGKERLLRAIDELQPLLSQPQPPFAALFCLGRCRELLFRYSERHEGLSLTRSPRDFQVREQEVREPFLLITARDVQRGGKRGELELLGSWGQAAQTAMEHFRWMNLNAGYDATQAIEALTWPGESAR